MTPTETETSLPPYCAHFILLMCSRAYDGQCKKIILVGNIGKDPKIRMMPDGTKIVSFSVATFEHWKDKTGADKSATEWHRVVVLSPKLAATFS